MINYLFNNLKIKNMESAKVEYVNREEMQQLKEAVEQPRLMQIIERLEMYNKDLDQAVDQIIGKMRMIDFRLLKDEEVAAPSPAKPDEISSFLNTVHSHLDKYNYLVGKIGGIERALRKLVGS